MNPTAGPVLVISHPPHGTVDLRQAGLGLGLTAADAGLKANYPAPEIWVVKPQRAEAETAAVALRGAKLNVVVAGGSELVQIPEATDVVSFDFTATALVATVNQATVEIPYERPVIAVVCKPRSDSGAASGPPRSSAPNLRLEDPTAAFVDLFHGPGATPQRLRFTALTDFAGLATGTGLSHSANVIKVASEMESRFRKGIFDHRLVNLRVRQPLRPGVVAPDVSRRKGYSYASYGLSELLRSLSPGLEETSQAEYSSRLVYLTTRLR